MIQITLWHRHGIYNIVDNKSHTKNSTKRMCSVEMLLPDDSLRLRGRAPQIDIAILAIWRGLGSTTAVRLAVQSR